jgi:hypothetical protein
VVRVFRGPSVRHFPGRFAKNSKIQPNLVPPLFDPGPAKQLGEWQNDGGQNDKEKRCTLPVVFISPGAPGLTDPYFFRLDRAIPAHFPEA